MSLASPFSLKFKFCDTQVLSGSAARPFCNAQSFMALKTHCSFSTDDDEYDSACVFEAKELAEILAADGKCGFRSWGGFSAKSTLHLILNELFHRLIVVSKVNFMTLKMASFCGCVDTPMVAYVGEDVYASFARHLLARCDVDNSSPASLHFAHSRLRNMKNNHLGVIVKALLAAASVAFEIEHNGEKNLTLSKLRKGHHVYGDVVVDFTVKAIIWEANLMASHGAGEYP